MAIIETVTESQFMDAFRSSEFRKDSFSYEGLKALYDYLWEYSRDINMDIELDIVAIDCDYTEFACIDEFWESYDSEEYPTIEAIEDYTTVIKVPRSSHFIIANF